MCFNSRTREGCDIAPIGNLTTPREGFNSRTREGCDDFDLFVIEMGDDVSIHAPGRGATVIF